MRDLPKFLTDLNPDIFMRDDYVVVDFEVDTSHGDYGNPVHPDNQLLLACWRLGADHPDFEATGGETQMHWGGELEQARLQRALDKASFMVAHNAKYELSWLKRAGSDLRKILPFDTQLAEYVLLGNLAAGNAELGVRPHGISLDECCRRRGMRIKDPVVDRLMKDKVNPVCIPRPWLQGRCKQDVESTEILFLDQRQALSSSNRLAVQYTRCLFAPVLADIQSEGMALDPEAVEKTYAEYKEKYDALSLQMQEMTGGINWKSPKQAAEFIYDVLGFAELRDKRGHPKRNAPNKRDPQGSRKTDVKTLDKLQAKTARQREFVALRKQIGKVSAALTKNLEFYIGVVREYGGTFYAELNQTSTATHRLSSTGIPLPVALFKGAKKSSQLQNQPRQFKRLFRAKRPGWLLAEPDGSSLEFRVAAQLGGPDPAAVADIEGDWDVHKFTASVLNSTTMEAVEQNLKEAESEKRDSWRQLAKSDTFKPLYGGTKGTPEQEAYYAAFRARYPGIAEAQRSWVDAALLTKKTVTPWGLVYYWPTARMSASGYVNVTSSVYNYPIQGLATAEIIPIAAVYLWHRIGAEDLDELIRLVNQVHDSAPAEIHPDAEEDFKRLSKQAFTHDVYRYLDKVYKMDFTVPLGVGIKIGSHWGTGKEEQWNVWKDGREKRVK